MTNDPFAATATINGDRPDDPFAAGSDVNGGGGTFVPRPNPEALSGCLIAMVPRKYESRAPKPEDYRQNAQDTTRERYTVDLYVLEGPDGAGKPFTFYYSSKVEGSDEYEQKEHTVEPGDFPYESANSYIVQAMLIGQLRNVAGSTAPIVLGRMRRGPKAKDRGKKDFATIEREWSEYTARLASGRPAGTKPEFAWAVDVAEKGTPDHDKALAWWRSAGIELRPVEKIN